MVYHESFSLETGIRVTFTDVTDRVKEIAERSGIKNGLVTVYSQHTSCCVFIQEDSEDVTYQGVPLVLQDMINALSKIIPTCEYEGQYLHPGRIHTEHAMEWRNEEPLWLLNTDAHLRSVLLGRSETVPVIDGEMILGEFGRIYFSDMDQTRKRTRTVLVQIMGE